MSEHHQLEFNGQLIDTDAKGYLLNSNDWSEALALVLAEQEGIVLEEPHWEVVRFVRAFYLEFNTSPPSAPWSRRWRSSTAPRRATAATSTSCSRKAPPTGHQDWRPAQTGEMHLKKYRAHPRCSAVFLPNRPS